jgi:hypothetical protein
MVFAPTTERRESQQSEGWGRLRRTSLLIVVSTALGCLAAPWVASPCAGDDAKNQQTDGKKAASEEILVFGKELNQLLDNVPGAVLLTGDKAREYLESSQKGERRDDPVVTVQQCVIRGEIQSDTATLHVEMTATADRDLRGPVPIGLGEAHLLKFTIDGGPPILSRDKDGWVAWVEGKGPHTIALDAQLVLGGSRNLPSLVFAIPEAPLTTLELRTPRAVSDVRVVPTAPVTVRAPGDAKPQIESALGPRNKVDLRWRWNDGERREPPPLVRAESQVTATVEAGLVQLTTDLSLAVLRGSQSRFELRVAPDERVLAVRRRDGTDVPFEVTADANARRITVQFPDALSGGAEIVVASQVPWSGESMTLRGMTIDGVFQHRTILALRPAADATDLDIAVTEVANARRIGLEELPPALRSPRNDAAFRSNTPPIQLKVSIVPRRPSTSVRTTAVLALDGDQATIFMQWQFSVHGGRVPHVDFRLPEHFDSSQFILAESVATVRPIEPDRDGSRAARVFLKGMPETFEVRLRATVPVRVAQNLTKLDLPWPRETRADSSRLFLAESTEASLAPTPEFSAVEESLDAAFAREIATPVSALRAFQSRSSLDRVSLRIAPLVNSVRYACTVRVHVEADRAVVRQTFDYLTLGARLRQRRFSVPSSAHDSVKLDSPGTRALLDSAGGEWVLRLAGEAAEPVRVEFSFHLPLDVVTPAEASGEFEIPLIRERDGIADSTELTLLSAEPRGLEVAGTDWKRVATSGTSDTTDTVAKQTFRRLGRADHVRLRQVARATMLEPRTVVKRALIETTVGPRNEWHTRARFFLTATDGGRVRLSLPEHSRLTVVRWAGRPIPARADAATHTAELNDELLGELPGVLELECESVSAVGRAWRDVLEWQPPKIVGNVSWGRVFWQVRLPDSLAVLRGPSQYSDENRLAWRGSSIGVAARMDDATLAEWLSGATDEAEAAGPERAYLFSRLTSADPLQLVVVNRLPFVLISSGVVLVFGLVLAASPPKPRLWLVVFAAVGLSVFFVFEPMAAIACARAAGLGLVLVLVAGACQAWLTRRSVRKRTVFPEAGVLAKVQSTSHRSSAEFAIGADADRVAPPSPTTSSPRRGARSSSVRS